MEELNLDGLGLTRNESKTYSVLLEHGTLSAGQISKFSQVPYGRIYDVLASLEQKGFVKIVPEKTKKFAPSDPNLLIEIINKKQTSFEKMKGQVKKMKEFYDTKMKNPVVLGYGRRAFYDLIKQQKIPQNYSYNIKWTSEYRPEWEANFWRNKKKGVEQRDLVRYDKETETNVEKWLKVGRKNIRSFDNGGVAISMVDDEEILISLIKSDTTLLIKDKPFVKVMKQLFIDSYKNADEIK